MPSMKHGTTKGWDSPTCCPSISAKTVALSPVTHSTAPTKSIRDNCLSATSSAAIFVVR